VSVRIRQGLLIQVASLPNGWAHTHARLQPPAHPRWASILREVDDLSLPAAERKAADLAGHVRPVKRYHKALDLLHRKICSTEHAAETMASGTQDRLHHSDGSDVLDDIQP